MASRDHASAVSTLGRVQQPLVSVIDADLSVQASLDRLICNAGWRCRMFASAEEFIAARTSIVGPSCIVSEVILAGLSGLDLQNLLIGEPYIPMVFLTNCSNVALIVRAMKAGAVEFLTKPAGEEPLAHALRSALERSNAALCQQTQLCALRERFATLSAREREVMKLVVSGLLNKQVADRLRISEITVKAHRGKVMRKMEADSLPALVHMAATLGLPPPELRTRSRWLNLEQAGMSAHSLELVPVLS